MFAPVYAYRKTPYPSPADAGRGSAISWQHAGYPLVHSYAREKQGTAVCRRLPFRSRFTTVTRTSSLPRNDVLAVVPPVAAAGWSLMSLLFGGGLFGAIVIFVIAKIFRK